VGAPAAAGQAPPAVEARASTGPGLVEEPLPAPAPAVTVGRWPSPVRERLPGAWTRLPVAGPRRAPDARGN
jgi:hypothetical protein